MNLRSLAGRLRAMDGDELRFRLVSETRKRVGRLRFAAARPRWHRRDLARILDPLAGPLIREARDAAARGDALAAHRALGRHFETRERHWPLAARDRARFSQSLLDRFPTAAIAARDRADRILDGRFDLLGFSDLSLGNPPDWHADRVAGCQPPRGYWASVPFLDPGSGDHKVIWELNRHQHFLLLGTAHWLTGDDSYRATFIAHLEDWLRANPPLDGVNWASMLELAFRALSWTWAVELFAAGAARDDTPWLVDLLVALDRQLTHVEENLSTYFSPNTHISGEALALYTVSRALPELKASAGRALHGRDILLHEADAQVRADGGHAERSSHYHRYSTDFYLLATLVARITGDAAAGAFEASARAQAAYLRTIADDHGRLPHIGDEDGGQLFRFGGAAPADASASLAALASALDDASLAVSAPPIETSWILGEQPDPAPGAHGAIWPSRVLPHTGYFVSRRPGSYLVFDAGPHGFLNGGHAHADALSVVLTVHDLPLLVDRGTPTYTMNPALRDLFRSPRQHNTVTVDERPFAEPRGPFHWWRTADARMLVARTTPAGDFAVGVHEGYGFPVARAVLTLPDHGWLIVDRVASPARASLEAWWHLHPAWSATEANQGFALTHASGLRLALATTAEDCRVDARALHSPDYGRLETATTLRTGTAGLGPLVIGTYLPARSTDEPAIALAGVEEDSDGWAWHVFTVSGLGEVRVPFALEARPRADWPQPCIQERRAICVE